MRVLSLHKVKKLRKFRERAFDLQISTFLLFKSHCTGVFLKNKIVYKIVDIESNNIKKSTKKYCN